MSDQDRWRAAKDPEWDWKADEKDQTLISRIHELSEAKLREAEEAEARAAEAELVGAEG